MAKTILNALLFQCLWFSAVQANDLIAVIAVVIFAVIHCIWFLKAGELMLISTTVIAGFFLETLAVNSGLLLFANAINFTVIGQTFQLPPIWLMTLWIGFAFTLGHSLSWLFNSRLAITVLSFTAVPFSYFAGFSFSSSESLSSPWYLGYLLEAALWCCLLQALASLHLLQDSTSDLTDDKKSLLASANDKRDIHKASSI